ncbi:germin-like protein 1 [Euphorbia peplus]|nr:germin-like protein 1 [Euphorbia peplus]
MNILLIIFLILCSSSCYTAVNEFCVADTLVEGPEGFNCKKLESITVKDFVFSGPGTPTQTSSLSKYSSTEISVDQVPGLNGLGISMAISNLEVGGFLPMNTHVQSTELLFMASGFANAGFITSTNTVYSANLKAGDVMVFPRGLLHYMMNSGNSTVVAYSSYTSETIDRQLMDLALFGNGLPTNVLEKVTFLDAAQINKLKAVFGGK